ncbi:hypothetical protein D3C84_1085960 [compost metagenome]
MLQRLIDRCSQLRCSATRLRIDGTGRNSLVVSIVDLELCTQYRIALQYLVSDRDKGIGRDGTVNLDRRAETPMVRID